MSNYRGWETATSLLLAYEASARAHKAAIRNAATVPGQEPHERYSYQHGFALLILNASIVEGTMRTILTERVTDDLNKVIERNVAAGLTEHTAPDRLLAKFLRDLESTGSWQKLTEASSAYLGAPMNATIPKEVMEGIDVLFVLRNVLAHGTALIQPVEPLGDDMKDVYPYDWQRRLQRVSVYLEAQFKKGAVFKNLAHPGMPEHFMDITKRYFAQISDTFFPVPQRAEITIEMIRKYHFGYMDTMR
ncbi:hypothetical protein [Pseudomonas sp. A-R-19]|uniref:hypothetical protein n=1 Tax=Pseudomonas sp. A-R-19 TaxID=2832403 RepID=UPI001CBECC28|nr:hypothetical protein [Pseudomonas sp. A-R-19]